MRIAIFSDVHANAIALDAVLEDIHAGGGVDAYWMIGDVTDMGSDPARCISRLQALPALSIVHGNGDRAVVRSDADALAMRLADISAEDVRVELMYLEEAAWARGAITAAGQFDWLASLPLEVRTTLPDGTRVLLVHASPGTDEGTGLRVEYSDDEIRTLLGSPDADLVIVGHTHMPLDWRVDDIRVFNSGSVSNPVTRDQRAMWSLLEADESGYRLDRRFVEYDREAYLRQVTLVHHPAEAAIGAFFDQAVGGRYVHLNIPP